MATNINRETSDTFAREKWRDRSKRYYSGRREKGEANIMNKGKYESRKKKKSHVMKMMKTSEYTYPKGHKTTKPRRSNRLQGSSVSSPHILIKRENGVVDEFLWDLVSKNRDSNKNQVMKIINIEVNKRFEWGKMDNDEDNSTSLFWIAADGGSHKWVTIKKSGITSTVPGKDIGYGLFAARDFEKDQKVGIYLGYERSEVINISDEIEYAITKIPKKRAGAHDKWWLARI